VWCTDTACTCFYGGSFHAQGETFTDLDGCNTCTCMAGGGVACTDRACVTCTFDRQTWQVGDTFPALDGCNTCTCMADGQISCTEMACPSGCSVETPCAENTGFCTRPDAPMTCGICFRPEDTCQTDADCVVVGVQQICMPLDCACSGEHVCVPGCTADSACAEGERCADDGHCKPKPCSAAAACPTNFTCEAGGCQRKTCTASAQCDGFCVGGGCFGEAGTCELPKP
jgi:hypothetical protein